MDSEKTTKATESLKKTKLFTVLAYINLFFLLLEFRSVFLPVVLISAIGSFGILLTKNKTFYNVCKVLVCIGLVFPAFMIALALKWSFYFLIAMIAN